MSISEKIAQIRLLVAGPPKGKTPEETVEIILGEDGTPIGCEVRDVSTAQWDLLYHKVRIHDDVTSRLAIKGLLDPEIQHPFLSNPEKAGEHLRFKIDLREGPRPVNLSWIYPSLKNK